MSTPMVSIEGQTIILHSPIEEPRLTLSAAEQLHRELGEALAVIREEIRSSQWRQKK